jgi:hypothetical protein
MIHETNIMKSSNMGARSENCTEPSDTNVDTLVQEKVLSANVNTVNK